MTNFRFQCIILICGLCIAIIKYALYIVTKSNAVFSDALESLVNISANSITLYSLYLASRPKDKSHPYGHGKVEFLAAGIEGTLLFGAGVVTIYKSILDYFSDSLAEISLAPMLVITILGGANYLLGYFSERRGERVNSPALLSGGKHLKSDGYTTLGILISLILIYFTKWLWLDTIVAVIVGLFILFQGLKVVKKSALDIVDTADEEMLKKIVDFLQLKRDIYWIDIHNFRIIKYGSEFHVDAHLTLPYYFTNLEVHREMKEVEELIKMHFDSTVELFIHPDPCESFCCHYCKISECPVRKESFRSEIVWTTDNVLENQKHGMNQKQDESE